jgi:hypothetical protein
MDGARLAGGSMKSCIALVSAQFLEASIGLPPEGIITDVMYDHVSRVAHLRIVGVGYDTAEGDPPIAVTPTFTKDESGDVTATWLDGQSVPVAKLPTIPMDLK